MHEPFTLGTLLRALSYVYWLLAIGALVVAIYRGKDRRSKIIGAMIVVAVFGFLPGKALLEQHQRDAYEKEAWAYFKKMCNERAGEKIYKKFTGVKSVVVIKPLPPATEKDLYDQYWYGDPYSNATPWDRRAYAAAAALATSRAPVLTGKHGAAFEFVESIDHSHPATMHKFIRMSFPYESRDPVLENIEKPTSRFGVAWEDISTPEDRKYWVAASRLRVIDLRDDGIVAERIGFFIESGFGSTAGQRRPWLTSRGPNTTCPYAHDWSDRWFLIRVLNPQSEHSDGQQSNK
jgi:hypothetical protein